MVKEQRTTHFIRELIMSIKNKKSIAFRNFFAYIEIVRQNRDGMVSLLFGTLDISLSPHRFDSGFVNPLEKEQMMELLSLPMYLLRMKECAEMIVRISNVVSVHVVNERLPGLVLNHAAKVMKQA